MIAVDEREFSPSFYLLNKHFQTIYPTLQKSVKVKYERERLTTEDNDFLDIDWIRNSNKNIVVLFHGLEGHSYARYMQGLAKVLSSHNYDVVSVNFRGCSGVPNTLLKSYHAGFTEDYSLVFEHVKSLNIYEKINAVGFSLGGNALVKYLGETQAQSLIHKAVGVSVPCDLESSAKKLSSGFSKIYLNRFLKRLKEKVRSKEKIFPNIVDYKGIYEANDFIEFDNLFTAPINGFDDVYDYWSKNSCKGYISTISTPTIILNAENDPFLPSECYPRIECENNEKVHLFTPKHGGHVGFPKKVNGVNYYEKVILEFFK